MYIHSYIHIHTSSVHSNCTIKQLMNILTMSLTVRYSYWNGKEV